MSQRKRTARSIAATSQYGVSRRAARGGANDSASALMSRSAGGLPSRPGRGKPGGSAAGSLLLGSLVFVEPLAVQLIDRAVLPHGADGGVDRLDQVGAGREDEPELLAAERLADDLESAGRCADVARCRRLI